MDKKIGRRELVQVASTTFATGVVASNALAQEEKSKKQILGVCCSPRKGMTTSSALQICLNSAETFNPNFETELIELTDFRIPAQLAAGQPLREGETDDFPKMVEKLGDPYVIGIIVGSPVYFGNMSALCKAFLEGVLMNYSEYNMRMI